MPVSIIKYRSARANIRSTISQDVWKGRTHWYPMKMTAGYSKPQSGRKFSDPDIMFYEAYHLPEVFE